MNELPPILNPPLNERAAVAKHLLRRGLAVSPEQVMLAGGAQHGLATTVMAMLAPGDVVAVDALSYPGFKLLAQAHRLELVAVPAGRTGPELDALTALCKRRRVKALYAMPTIHNPLGWVMSATARRDLVALARRHGLLIIEDAAYAFLAESPPAPLAALAPAMALMREQISVSTAEPFATSAQVPHAIRLALGSLDIATLRRALATVASVISAHTS